MTRSYYSKTITGFLQDDETRILGELSLHHNHALEDLQKNAWVKQIKILKDSLKHFEKGQIYFEFSIPRMGKRVDNILIINDLIFVLEFKVGDSEYQKHSIEQVVDYCLDLQNIHNQNDKTYLQNAYRVLLTRARQGLIIFIPNGDDIDHTRPKEFYDTTFNYFQSCGIPTL